MKALNIAIAAEFELCEKMAEALEESILEINRLSVVEIIPFGEERGVRFNNRAVPQLAPDEIKWEDFDYLLFAGDPAQAAHMADAAEAGCAVIDVKGVTAGIAGVPVVVPTVNDDALAEMLQQRNILALPDPQVSQLVLSLAQFLPENPINQIFVTSLLPASYTDGETVSRLVGQTARLLNGIPLDENERRLAFDVFPQGNAGLSTQIQKIYPGLDVTFHSIRTPVFYGLAQNVTLSSDYELSAENLNGRWLEQPLIQGEDKLITPVINGENDEETPKLHLGNVHGGDNRLSFWSVADEQRFNLALLAIKVLEGLCEQSRR